jgi:hypothetical protein
MKKMGMNSVSEKRSIVSAFMLKIIILPRQAREKHGKSQKGTPFVQVDVDAIAPADDGEGPVAAQSTGEKTHLLRHFYTKNDQFTKTGSGQT